MNFHSNGDFCLGLCTKTEHCERSLIDAMKNNKCSAELQKVAYD